MYAKQSLPHHVIIIQEVMDAIKNAVVTPKKQFASNLVIIVFGVKEFVYLI